VTITDLPPRAAPTHPASDTPDPVSAAAHPVSAAAGLTSATPGAEDSASKALGIGLMIAAAIGGTIMGAIGFSMSYNTLAVTALHWGFSPKMAPWFPVGVDSSIVVCLALDLYLVKRQIPWSVLRMAAHAMTAATIWFNASSQGSVLADPVRSASHGVMPILFVIGVEAARRLIIQKARLQAGITADGVPLHRWLLSPIRTPRFYRRMRLYSVTSYTEMVRRDQELIAYELWLKRKYNGDISKATQDERLPMTMAPYGYTVAQALAMPAEQERAAELRAEEAERRQREAETRRQKDLARAAREKLLADGEVETTRAEVEAATGEARAAARAKVSAAERAAEAEAQALETALMAEARARTAKAEQDEAEARLAQAEADTKAAEEERRAAAERRAAEQDAAIAELEARAVETAEFAEARRRAAEADRLAAEAEKVAAETRRAAAESDEQVAAAKARAAGAAEAEERSKLAAAEAAQRAAEARLAVAEIERRAVEAEDVAKLKPRERAARKVARMILATEHQDPERLPLSEIQRELEVSSPATASEYRTEAAQLLAAGYRA
jgi:hypothetical protein